MEKCNICLEYISKPLVVDCCKKHPVCRMCMRQYLQHSKHHDYSAITCTTQGCLFTFKNTQNLVDAAFDTKAEIDQWWSKVLVDVYIKNKVTCPFGSCKAVFDSDEELTKQCIITECYECHRGFCVACMKEWHPGEIRIVNDRKEALKTLETAKRNLWTRCPTCRKIAQKISGCLAVTCVCGSTFCYRCGSMCIGHNCTRMCNRVSQAQINTEREYMFKLPPPNKKI